MEHAAQLTPDTDSMQAAEPQIDRPRALAPGEPVRGPRREPKVVRFFTKRIFIMVTTEPIPGARSLQWCLTWAGAVVLATIVFAGFGLRGLSPLVAMALIALQFGVLAYLLSLLGYEENRGQVRPARTPLPSYLSALTAVAATTLAGVSLFMTGLDVLAKWAGEKLDLIQGLLALVFLGLSSLAAIALAGVWVTRSVAARLRLQPGEMAVLVLEAVLLVAVSFIVLLAW